jgi:hypothetical protein
MPLVGTEATGQYWEPFANGPVAQVDMVANDPAQLSAALPTVGTIAASGNWTSNVLISDGFKAIGAGCKSTQTGAINIQRYLDRAGTVPVGAVVTAALVANTSQWATVNDGVPFQSFTVQITNTGGGAATITLFDILLSAA